jgi:hypothetical protein
MKQEAASGDGYAQRQLERATTKQCSHCRGTDHNRANCQEKFNDERLDALSRWAAMKAAINVIKDKKIAEGAFVYGPILHRWSNVPVDATEHRESNYTMGNYSIKEMTLNIDSVNGEFEGAFSYDTLTECEGGNYFRRALSLPYLSKEMQRMPDSAGRTKWFSRNDVRYDRQGRDLYDENFNVLVEAPQEAVDSLVEKLKAMKPMIVDFEDMKQYNSAKRKEAINKKKKEEAEWQD